MLLRFCRLPPVRIGLGLLPGERLGAHPGVPGERPDIPVPRLGLEHRRAGAELGVMAQARVPQLVQGRAARPALKIASAWS